MQVPDNIHLARLVHTTWFVEQVYRQHKPPKSVLIYLAILFRGAINVSNAHFSQNQDGFVPKRGTANAVEQCPACLLHTDRLYSGMN